MSGQQANQEEAVNLVIVEQPEMTGGVAERRGPYSNATELRQREVAQLVADIMKKGKPLAAMFNANIDEYEDNIKTICEDLFRTREPRMLRVADPLDRDPRDLFLLSLQKGFQKEAAVAMRKYLVDGWVDPASHQEKGRGKGDKPGPYLFSVSVRPVPRDLEPRSEDPMERLAGPRDIPEGYETFEKEYRKIYKDIQEGYGKFERRLRPYGL